MNKPSIDIVIRARNEAQFLELCVQKLRSQSIPISDIILVYDTRTTDCTLAIAKRLGLTIVEIDGSQFSYGRALNVGCSAAQADFIVLVSAHAIPCNNEWLEYLMAPFQEPDVAATYSRQVPHQDAGRFMHLSMNRAYPREGVKPAVAFSNAAAIIRTEVWEQDKFDEMLLSSEDAEWAERVRSGGRTIAYCPKSEIYHSHKESFSRMVHRGFLDEYAMVHLGHYSSGWKRLVVRAAKIMVLLPMDLVATRFADTKAAIKFRIAQLSALTLVHLIKKQP